MGLDMYLHGRKVHYGFKDERKLVDGFELDEEILQLGYWRKHPNLHGYIVNTFANGIDECQKIGLDADQLRAILDASESDQLPPTSGFFFGESQPEDKPATKKIIKAALKWLETTDPLCSRSVYYKASW